MQIKFDWVITPAAIISTLWFVILVPVYQLAKRWDTTINKIMFWLKEYPPHIHDKSDEDIRYPKGMAPDKPDKKK